MSKFLYITDQDEYDDHSFIGPLFQKYLTKYFEINTTFFSKEKTQIEIKKNVIALTDEIRGRAIYPTLENVFVTGWTRKGFDGNNLTGDIDIFVTKFGKH